MNQNNSLNDLVAFALRSCPEGEDAFKSFYFKELAKVLNLMGELLYTNKFTAATSGKKHIQGYVPAITFATEMFTQMQGTNFRSWGEARGANIPYFWDRLSWSIALWYPIGFSVSNFKYITSSDKPSWSPFNETFGDFTQNGSLPYLQERSYRGLSPYAISNSLFNRFSNLDYELSGHMMAAAADCFSDRPNNDNPIWRAMRNSARKCFGSKGTQNDLPFYFDMFIDHLFSYTDGYVERFQFIRNDLLGPNVKELVRPELAAKDKNVQEVISASKPSISPAEVVSSSQASALEILKQDILQTDTAREDGFTTTPRIEQALNRYCKDRMAAQECIFNAKGGVGFKINGKALFIVPMVYKQLGSILDIPVETVVEELMSCNLIATDEPLKVLLERGGSKRTVKVIEVNISVIEELVPGFNDIEDNTHASVKIPEQIGI
jgi:hypothetical protein